MIPLKKVLLLDPDERTMEKTALRLSVLDLQVLKAASVSEALGLWGEGNPDLVVADWPLPDGYPGTAFQAKLARGAVPVVFCLSPDETAPVPDGLVTVPKQDRQELMNLVGRLLAEVPPPPGGGRGDKPARQILIIEDSPTLRGILRRTLEKAFPADVIREAVEGRQALAEMSQKKVDLIITDLEMPGMDGATFLGHLKKTPLLARKPILIFSGNITEALVEQAAPLPNVRFLRKPAAPERVAMEVAQLLGS